MIDYPKIMAMIEHWLESEINGYFGSDYGPDFNSILLAPLSAPVANNFIEKMKSIICSWMFRIKSIPKHAP